MATIPSTCKFHVVSSTVDTTDRGSAELQSQRHIYTMADITETVDVSVSPYKTSTGACSITPVEGNNPNSGVNGVISGGCDNTISGTSGCAAIVGGTDQVINDSVEGFIGGGDDHDVCSSNNGAVVGGLGHLIDSSNCGFIGGGGTNKICTTSTGATIGGGFNNTINGGACSAIIGGKCNCITKGCSVIGGGQNNEISDGNHQALLGGCCNCMDGGDFSAILGGKNNCSECGCSMIVGSDITTDRVCTTFVNNLSIMSIPVASAGLPSGAVWNDGGTLKIV